MARTTSWRTAAAFGALAVLLPMATACGGDGRPASSGSGSPSATAGSTAAGGQTATVQQEQATVVGGLHVGIAAVHGHTAMLQVVGPHVKYRVVKAKAGQAVHLPGHTLTVTATHGSGSNATVTVRVTPR